MSALLDLRTGISLTSLKGDTRQPHNYAMGRVPEGFSRWQTASLYLTDVERIIQELKTGLSFVSTPPDDAFLLSHSVNYEDYIMYHQGYFLDLVHQLKDKLCQLTKALLTFKGYSKKHEKVAELRRLLTDQAIQRVPNLTGFLKEWDDSSHPGPISIVLKKRTFYHHYKNPLPNTDSYFKAKTNRFLLSPSFQSQLSEYGKQMIAERGKQSLQSWQSDTADKMSKTIAAIETNVEGLARSLISYLRLPNPESGKRTVQRYVKLDEVLVVPDSTYSIETIQQPIRNMLEILREAITSALGQELIALYVTGSVPRGDFNWGLSDVNFVVVIKNDIPEIKSIIKSFIESPAIAVKMPVDTKIISEDDFVSPQWAKLRFICRTDGLLLAGSPVRGKESDQKICFKLAWMLNEDFKDYVKTTKANLADPGQVFTPRQLTLIARELGKRTYRLGFSQVIGNNVRYSSRFKEMHELNSFYYPQNRAFNRRTFDLIDKYPLIDRDGLLSVVDSLGEKMMPLYDAVDRVVNGI